MQVLRSVRNGFAVGVCALAALGGCATHETYGDRALPEAQRAVIEGYSRYLLLYFEDLQIVSVDGGREGGQRGWPYASSVSVPSGTHRVQFLILRNSRDIALCSFEWTFEAGRRYELAHLDHEAGLLAHPMTPRYPATISMDMSAPSMPTQRLRAPAECAVPGK
jgi:hypothetical protein